MLLHAWHGRVSRPAAFSLMMVVLFMSASAAAIAFGRISPEQLASNGGQPLPSRYLVPTFVFWAALFAVALTFWRSAWTARLGAAGVSLAVVLLSFGVWNWQWRMPHDWAAVSQGFDAIASGFFMPVSDQEFMSRIFAPEERRTRLAGYMRQQRLSVFAEPRANWLGQDAAAIAPARPDGDCHAAIRMAAPLGGNPPVFRIAGKLTLDGRSPVRLLDLLMTDDRGIVIGLARTLPVQSEGAAATEFFGYARGWSRAARLVVLAGGRVTCEVAGMDEAR